MPSNLDEQAPDIGPVRLNRRRFLAGVATCVATGAAATRLPARAATSGLQGTAINHVSYESADYKKTRDFYVSLFGFQVSDEDDKQLYLWAGNTLISAKNSPNTRVPRVDHFGITVEPWDLDAIQNVLKARGLVGRLSQNDPHDPAIKSVFVRDPDGYTLQLCARDLELRPSPVASHSPLKAVGINHFSFACADHTKTIAFYRDLLNARVSNDDGTQAYLWFGDAFLVVKTAPLGTPASVDQFAWTLANWNPDAVAAELTRHGLEARLGDAGKSILTKDLNGFPLELCSKELSKRSDTGTFGAQKSIRR